MARQPPKKKARTTRSRARIVIESSDPSESSERSDSEFASVESPSTPPRCLDWPWITACPNHVCRDRASFSTYTPLPPGFSGEIVDFHRTKSYRLLGIGTVILPTSTSPLSGEDSSLTLEDVLHVPDAPYNIITRQHNITYFPASGPKPAYTMGLIGQNNKIRAYFELSYGKRRKKKRLRYSSKTKKVNGEEVVTYEKTFEQYFVAVREEDGIAYEPRNTKLPGHWELRAIIWEEDQRKLWNNYKKQEQENRHGDSRPHSLLQEMPGPTSLDEPIATPNGAGHDAVTSGKSSRANSSLESNQMVHPTPARHRSEFSDTISNTSPAFELPSQDNIGMMDNLGTGNVDANRSPSPGDQIANEMSVARISRARSESTETEEGEIKEGNEVEGAASTAHPQHRLQVGKDNVTDADRRDSAAYIQGFLSTHAHAQSQPPTYNGARAGSIAENGMLTTNFRRSTSVVGPPRSDIRVTPLVSCNRMLPAPQQSASIMQPQRDHLLAPSGSAFLWRGASLAQPNRSSAVAEYGTTPTPSRTASPATQGSVSSVFSGYNEEERAYLKRRWNNEYWFLHGQGLSIYKTEHRVQGREYLRAEMAKDAH